VSENYVIGADVGTVGCKVAIFDEGGGLVAENYQELALHYPRPGWVEQDPDDFYHAVVTGIRACLERSGIAPGSVAALALDGQMAGVCTVDGHWGTPTVYDSWLDTRCTPYIPVMKEHEPLIIARTGGPVSFAHGPKILWWKGERPETFRKIAKFVQPAGYVAGRMAGLSGEDAFIDYTYLFFSGFSDTPGHRWLPELCDLFGVPVEKLPRRAEGIAAFLTARRTVFRLRVSLFPVKCELHIDQTELVSALLANANLRHMFLLSDN